MIRYLRLMIILMKYKLTRSMIYSFNFWIAFFVDFILFAFQLLAFASIYRFIDTINGWTLNQMFVFIGTFSIVDSLAMGVWFFGLLPMPEKIRNGTLDVIIVKPVDTQFYLSCEGFNPGSLLGIITGAIMVGYGMINGGFSVTPSKIGGYILLVVMMNLVMYSLFLIIRTWAFFFVKIDALTQAEDSIVEFAFRIPGTAFKGISKFIFMVCIPYGLIATVPTEFITNLLDLNEWAAVCGITLFFLMASRL
ncbi:MAG: ABC-2 family transporter protein, partial [Spirochaetaceae bacterium]|nr:ABC-2 family transporter protein [Spirochaetaceae bacterium]